MNELVYFPGFEDGEIVIGLMSRVGELYRLDETVIKSMFFEKNSYIIHPTLPGRLGTFVKALPFYDKSLARTIALNQTLLGLYTPFISQAQIDRVIANMTSESEKPNGWAVVPPKWGSLVRLRYCPKCAQKDRAKFGFAFWHREHQVPGIDVCFNDRCYLEEIPFSVLNAPLISAETLIPQNLQARYILDNSPDQHKLSLAKNLMQLLSINTDRSFMDVLQIHYECLLHDHGFKHGQFRYLDKLVGEVREFYTNQFLSSLQLGLPETASTQPWIQNLLRKDISKSYLQHFLFINFFGYSIADLLTNPPSLKFPPFGNGPWKCLNKICSSYFSPIIKKISIKRYEREDRATLECPNCGYTYVIRKSEYDRVVNFTDKTVIPKVLITSYGYLWTAQLTRLWGDLTISLRQMAKILGTTRILLLHEVIRNNLQIPRNPLTGITKLELKAQGISLDRANKQMLREELKKEKETQYKKILLDAMDAHLDWGLSELKLYYKKETWWLGEFCSEWLVDTWSERYKVPDSAPSVDHAERDLRYVQQVPLIVQRILDLPGKPVRVTQRNIIVYFDKTLDQSIIYNHMPKTLEALQNAREDTVHYRIRRLWWCAREMVISGKKFSMCDLLRKVNIRDKDDPIVLKAYNEVSAWIAQELTKQPDMRGLSD